jgi:hypothetical protein
MCRWLLSGTKTKKNVIQNMRKEQDAFENIEEFEK